VRVDRQQRQGRGEALPAGDRRALRKNGAESGAVGEENGPINPDVARVIEVWDLLATDTRRAIVEASRGR